MSEEEASRLENEEAQKDELEVKERRKNILLNLDDKCKQVWTMWLIAAWVEIYKKFFTESYLSRLQITMA